MADSVIQIIEAKYKKKAVVDVRSGDTVKVHQKIREGGKERVQIFEGLVIKTSRGGSLSQTFSVRRIASGVGVEKTYLIHSPSILKIEIIKRSKVRRNYISYIRELTGKSSRLTGVDFDKESINAIDDEQADAEEIKIQEQAEAQHEAEVAKKTEERAKEEAKFEKAMAKHNDQAKADDNKKEAEPPSQKDK